MYLCALFQNKIITITTHMKTFEELGVSPEICKAVTELGFEYPMPVQEEVIPYLLSGDSDVVALAQTGTGKTAAFGLPILQKIDAGSVVPQSLILSPTRELCLQIASDLKDFSRYLDGVRVLPVYGGSSIESQIRSLKQGVHVIVATPGRLLDLMRRNVVKLDNVKNVVLDEADEMLDMGFSEDLNAILDAVPQERSTLMFSATMSKEIEKIAKNYLHDAKEITIGRKNEGTANVNHVVYCVHAKDKYETLKRIVDFYPNIYGIIFCRTRLETQEIADKLMQEGYNADALHGELSQAARDLVMQKFRLRHLQLLVATDVAARGLDVDDLTHVINYGLPDDIEYYTHRSGRTGRAGKKGTSIAIINLREKGKVRQIEKVIGQQFQQGEMPTGKQICKKQLMKVIDNLEKVQVNEEEIAEFMPEVLRKLDWLDKEDVIKRMVSMEFNRFLNYYHDREDIELDNGGDRKRDRKNGEGKRGEGRSRGGRDRKAEEGYTRLFINLGKMDGLRPNDIMGMINRNVKGEHVNIGRIDLMKTYSFFEVDEASAEDVVRGMARAKFGDRQVNVEIAGEATGKSADKEHNDEHKNTRNGERNAERNSEHSADRKRGDRQDRRSDDRRGRQQSDKPRRGEGRRQADGRGNDDGQIYSKKEMSARGRSRNNTSARSHKDDWKQFFEHENNNNWLVGDEPDFSEGGWAKPMKKKRKK